MRFIPNHLGLGNPDDGPAPLVARGRVLVAGVLLLVSCAGWWSCSGRQTITYDYPAVLMYDQQADSLGLSAFLALPADQQETRRILAARWRELANGASTVPGRLRALHNAVGLAAVDAEAWLDLAELNRWCGHHRETERYLTAAAPAIKLAPPLNRESLWLRMSLLAAWHHYDRGDWYEGLAWSDSILAIRPSDHRTLLIRGLLLAGVGRSRDATYLAREIERIDFFLTDWRWIRGITEYHRDALKEAFNIMRFSPSPEHRAECWHDMGMVAERTAHWTEAERFYSRAFSSLPLQERSCLFEHRRRSPGAKADDEEMPVWLAFDRFYVTGSRVAYTALALARLEASTASQEREFWGDAALNAASVCVRKLMGLPWTRSWRGRAYTQLEMYPQADTDLTRALRGFDRLRVVDAPTLASLGHVKLRREEFSAALPLLRRAVAADTACARTWSDLGYALIMIEDLENAMITLDRALVLDPTLAVAWYNRGLMNFHAQRWEEAVADLQEAARLAPDNPSIAEVLQRAILMVQRNRRQQ